MLNDGTEWVIQKYLFHCTTKAGVPYTTNDITNCAVIVSREDVSGSIHPTLTPLPIQTPVTEAADLMMQQKPMVDGLFTNNLLDMSSWLMGDLIVIIGILVILIFVVLSALNQDVVSGCKNDTYVLPYYDYKPCHLKSYDRYDGNHKSYDRYDGNHKSYDWHGSSKSGIYAESYIKKER